MKTVIVGNSGSGKTWLATRLAACNSATVIHLDALFWEPGGFDKKRSGDEVAALIESSKRARSWVAEGVFGELAQRYLSEAEALVWLDLDWPECRRRLEQRGSESKAHMERTQSAEGLAKLVEWASTYYSRSDSRSFQGHRKLFDSFLGCRVRIRSKESVSAFIDDAQQGAPADALKRASELWR